MKQLHELDKKSKQFLICQILQKSYFVGRIFVLGYRKLFVGMPPNQATIAAPYAFNSHPTSHSNSVGYICNFSFFTSFIFRI